MKYSISEVADTIEAFINGTTTDWDWDDFISIKIDDPKLEEVRVCCAKLPDEFPPTKTGHYCNNQGIEVLKNLLKKLRTGA